jgi:crotonobetainyl-CoA:carnitine CoA-transferase CaiB-like acyl-CoA transferase
VSSALFESAVFLMGSHMAGLAATGEPPPPMPARRGAWGIYDVFATAGEGQIFIGVTSDAQWRRFCDAFGLDAMADDPRLATNALRAAARDWLIPALGEVTAALPQEEVARRCEAAGISWAPVGRPADLFADPHLLAAAGCSRPPSPPWAAGRGRVAEPAAGVRRRPRPRHLVAPTAAAWRALGRRAGGGGFRRRRDRGAGGIRRRVFDGGGTARVTRARLPSPTDAGSLAASLANAKEKRERTR